MVGGCYAGWVGDLRIECLIIWVHLLHVGHGRI